MIYFLAFLLFLVVTYLSIVPIQVGLLVLYIASLSLDILIYYQTP